MKHTLLALALAAATMPLTFAQATPSNQAPSSTTTQSDTKMKTTKKHKKHTKKSKSESKDTTSTTPQK